MNLLPYIFYSILLVLVTGCGNNEEIFVDVKAQDSDVAISFSVTKPLSLTALADENSDIDLSIEGLSIGLEVKIYSDLCLTQIGSFTSTSSNQSFTLPNQLNSAGQFNIYIKNQNSECTGPKTLSIYNCPAGYTYVPKTLPNDGAFCVMMYEARNDGSSNLSVNPIDSLYNNIQASDAKTKCTSVGSHYDLISNIEWMSIARNLELNNENWSGNSRGIGTMARGWARSNTGPKNQTDASCESNLTTNGCAVIQTGANFFHNRTLKLSTGVKLWDFVGNLREWVDATKGGTLDKLACNNSIENDTNWIDFISVDCPTLSLDDFNSPYGYDSVAKVGRLFPSSGTGSYVMRGGANGDNNSSGIYSMSFSSSTGAADTARGFRCVFRP